MKALHGQTKGFHRPSFYAEYDSVNNSYQWRSPLGPNFVPKIEDLFNRSPLVRLGSRLLGVDPLCIAYSQAERSWKNKSWGVG